MDISNIKEIYGARTPGVIGKHRFYSVLVPFCMVKEAAGPQGSDGFDAAELSLIYEVRSGKVSQPGEVCFPGGHVEDGETPEECAVRETCEELGVGEGDIKVIGQGDTICGNGNFTLYTYIGEVDFDAYRNASADPAEVSETFTVPVRTLMDAEPQHYGETMRPVIEQGFPYEKVGIDENYPWRTPVADIPVYDLDGRIIWGLTGRITENVINVHEALK